MLDTHRMPPTSKKAAAANKTTVSTISLPKTAPWTQMFPSPSVRVRVRESLLELAIHTVVADGGRATRLLAELADVDLSIAAFALFLAGG